jgi:multiple sugar transport system permease protein
MRAQALSGRRRRLLSEWGWALLFIAPSIVGLAILNVAPFFQSIWLSLFDKQSGAFGLSNYVRMFTGDEYFWRSNLNTLYFTALTVPVGVLLALAVLLHNERLKARNLYRGIFFLPLVCAPAAVAIVWKWIVFNSKSGFLNYALSMLGVKGPNWIADPSMAMISIAIVAVWGTLGYDFVLLLAGLQGISKTYYEAARIDGAGTFKQFRYITVPLISPTLFFVVIMRLMNAMRQFDLTFMFTRDTDPPFRAVQTLLYQFYRETFVKLNVNYGSAIVVWTVLLILLVTAAQFALEKRWVHYDN